MCSAKATITNIETAGADVRIFHISTTNEQIFDFQAGQYIELTINDFPARPYSLANAPDKNNRNRLEIHIKDSGKGGMSSHAVQKLNIGDNVSVAGPFGDCTLDKADKGKILMIAGGMGIAPIKALIEEAQRTNHPDKIALYWGARTKDSLYLADFFTAKAAASNNFSFVPVIDRPVGEKIYDDFPDLSGYSLYIAGPPEMLHNTIPLLLERGAHPHKIHTDHTLPLNPAAPENKKEGSGHE